MREERIAIPVTEIPSLETRIERLEAKVAEQERFINLLIRNDGERSHREQTS